MPSSIRIGRILGIPIQIHFTFLAILLLFVYAFSVNTTELLGFRLGFGYLDAGLGIRYVFGTAAAVVFFVTVVAHELAHSYAAIRYGVRIKSITLMLFGGVAALEEIPKKPRQELTMALAGPLTSLGIGLASYAGMVVMEAMPSGTLVEGVTILLGLIAFYNIILAGFNLLPAFPMDGGRVLRAALAMRMSHIDATRMAAKVGRGVAIAVGVFGALTLNFILVIIAVFVYFGAKEEEQATVIADSLEGLRVRQLMTDVVQVVHPDMTMQQLLDVMLSTRHTGFPVVDRGVVGVVTISDAQKVPKDRNHLTMVRDIMNRNAVTIHPDTEAPEAMKLMSGRGVGMLLVVDGNRLVGIVTREDFLRAVDIMLARRRGTAWQQVPPGQTPPPSSPPPPISPPTAYG